MLVYKNATEKEKEQLFLDAEKLIYYFINIHKELLNQHEADDLYSCGCLTFMRCLNSYDDKNKAKFTTYFARALNNNYLLMKKQYMIRCNRITENCIYLDNIIFDNNNISILDKLSSDTDICEELAQKESLDYIMGNLADDEKKIILLYYDYGYSQQKIGKMMGIARNTVSRKLIRILKKLKKDKNLF